MDVVGNFCGALHTKKKNGGLGLRLSGIWNNALLGKHVIAEKSTHFGQVDLYM